MCGGGVRFRVSCCGFAVLRSVFWVAGARLLGGGSCGGGRGWAFPAIRREMKKIVLLSFFWSKVTWSI